VLETVLEWPEVPANSALFFETREEAVAHPRGSFRLTVCHDCGFAFNADFDERLPEYSGRNLETQLWSASFRSFAESLAREWIDRHRLRGAHALEIGAGRHGDFLRLFCELSGGTGVGLDPVAETTDIGAMRLVSRAFDGSWCEPADAVICRHTLEHVGAVSGFLDALAAWAAANPGAVHLFEVPDLETILDRDSFWDLYYEHASYFTRETLREAFERQGFEVLRCVRAFDDQYVILEARFGRERPAAAADADRADGEAALAAVKRLAARYGELAPAVARRLEELREDGPVLVWQAGAKAAALLAIPGVAEAVDALVDVNPDKRGRFIVGTGHRVLGAEDIAALRPAHVVLMNAVYRDEIERSIGELGVDAALHTVEELRFQRARPG